MPLIGPGSEWFWSMLQLVVVAVSLVGLYRQVRLQTSAGAIEQATALARDWSSEQLHRSRLAVLLALRDGNDPADIPQQPSIDIGNYWERVGYLVRKGHLDRDIVYNYLGNVVRLWWALLRQNTDRLRERQHDPSIYEHFEWLAGINAELDRRAGSTTSYDAAALAERIHFNIGVSRDAIRAAEEIRGVRSHSSPPPRWTFVSEEVSPGQFRVVGHDEAGHEVERRGAEADIESLMREAWLAAWWVERQAAGPETAEG